MNRKTSKPTLPAKVVRLQDWPTHLFRVLEERRSTKFEWSRMDCCLFACDAVLAQTGHDPAAGIFRGKYRDALGAARLVKKHGGIESIAVKTCAKHSWPEIPVLTTQRGDVLLTDQVGGEGAAMGSSLGVSVGTGGAFAGAEGLVFLPLSECRRAWRISYA